MGIIKATLSRLGIVLSRFEERAFLFGLFTLVLFKLWLIHGEEIYGYTTVYDCLWYLNSAKHWYWGMPYDWTAFFRPPAYPLFIALVHTFGIPLRTAIELLQAGAYLFLIAALRKVAAPRWLCWFIFAALLFHPVSFQLNNYALADPFYAAVLTFLIAGLIFTLVTRCIPAAVFSGIAFAILWNTREENLLLPLIVIAYFLLAFFYERSAERSWRDAFNNVFRPAMSIVVAASILILTVNTLNYRAFGEFAKSETSGPSFRAAYRALLRIKPSEPKRFVGVTHEAREAAYGVSPAFAQLRPFFEGKLGHDWELETFSTHRIPGEIGNAWFMWAVRNIASEARLNRDPQTAHRFYRQVSDEINLAAKNGQVPSRVVFADFLDPNFVHYLRFLPQSCRRIAGLFVLPREIMLDREDDVMRPAQRALYDEMAGRRVALTRTGVLRIVGWAFEFGDPLQLVGYDSGGGEITSAMTRFGPRPDLVENFKARGEVPLNTEFGLPIEVRRGEIPPGDLIFVTRSGRKFVGSTSLVLAGELPKENGAADGAPLMCQIFAREFTPSSDSTSVSFENLIGKLHPYFIKGLTVAGIIAALILGIFFRRIRIRDPHNAAIALLAATILCRFMFFAFLDATSWNTADLRYLFPIMPLYSVMLILLIYQAARITRGRAETPVVPS